MDIDGCTLVLPKNVEQFLNFVLHRIGVAANRGHTHGLRPGPPTNSMFFEVTYTVYADPGSVLTRIEVCIREW